MITKYFVEFIIYSFLGWVWESIYCTIKNKEWADRGFLFGPVCPIYGFCAVAASILFQIIGHFTTISDAKEMNIVLLFLIGMVGSAIVEFITSWALETRFGARWWDYSDVPLNINGRVCLPVSVSFGLAGIVIIRYLLPAVEGMDSFVHPLVYDGLAVVFAGVLGIDFGMTISSLSSALKMMQEYKQEWNEKAERTYENIAAAPEQLAEALAEKKEQLQEAMAEAKEAMAGAKEKVTLPSASKLAELSSGVKLPEVSDEWKEKYALRMSPAQLHVISNIKKFGRRSDKKNNVDREAENRFREYLKTWRNRKGA